MAGESRRAGADHFASVDSADSADSAVDAFLRAAAKTDEAAPELEAGASVGAYRVIERLGRGGMGVVYLAQHEVTRRRVALKVLPDPMLRDEARRRRFLREARLASALSHPCIATVYEAGADGDRLFLAMELVIGETLRARLKSGPLEIREVCRIGREIARALAAAHAKGVVHRDVKPDNVMCGGDGAVKVLDFGLAKLGSDVEAAAAAEAPTLSVMPTREGHILGTPSYMSPEQAKGLPIDARTDIFSLGVVLYELATGRLPFAGATTLDTLIAISRDEPPPPSRLRRDMPRALEAWVLRCMAKRRAERPSAAEVDRALDGLARGERPALPRRGWRTAAVALVCLGVGSAALVWASHGSPDAQPFVLGADPELPSPFSRGDAILACPILEARGVAAPTGWLGAAAADYACRRATWILGGSDERTLLPADLLELPAKPTEDMPADPYSDAGARERSMEAARRRAAVLLDGRVERSAHEFRVELRAETSARVPLGSASGAAPRFDEAVARAVDGLSTVGAIPRAEALGEEARRWWTVDSIDVAVHLDDLINLSLAPKARCSRLEPHFEVLRRVGPEIDTFCQPPAGSPAPDLESIPAVALAATQVPEVDVTRARERLREARAVTSSSLGKARLAAGEGWLAMRQGKSEEARGLFLHAVALRPRDTHGWWGVLLEAAQTSSDTSGIVRGMRAWLPYEPEAWSPPFGLRPEQRDVVMHRRGVELAPDGMVLAAAFAELVVERDRLDDARSIASDWATRDSGEKEVSDYVLALVAIHEARFGAALAHLRSVYERGEETFVVERATYLALEVGEATGLLPTVVDGWIDRVILAQPTRLNGNIAGPAAAVCLRAQGDRGRVCIERTRTAARSRKVPIDFIEIALQAAELRLAGEKPGAAKLLRRLLSGVGARLIPAGAFDAPEDTTTAVKLDQMHTRRLAGITLAEVRAARRAARRGDHAGAAELAGKILDAWAKTDVELPALAEMRILARGPKGG